jgi:hypothetical protein
MTFGCFFKLEFSSNPHSNFMKSLLQLTCFVLLSMLFACKNDTENENSKKDAAQVEAELPSDPAERMAARSRNPVNTPMAMQLAGTWRSATETR